MSNVPDFDPDDLSDGTLYESEEDRDDLLGPGSNFRWRIRITSADLRRLFRRGPLVKVKLRSTRLPQNLEDFRKCVTDACPDGRGKAFRVRSIVWPTSPYTACPVNFSRDKWFDGSTDGEDPARAIQQDEVYRRLLESCARYASTKAGAMVVYDIEVHFLKAGKGIPS